MRQGHVAVVGSAGFVGSSVCNAAQQREIVRISRDNHGAGWRVADITTMTGARDAVRGVSSIIHCASYVGPDNERAKEVNVRGTGNLMQAAREAGIESIVYLSTSGVFGSGPHRGLDDSARTEPTSTLSSTRLNAEDLVTAHGGSVVRPHLVYGQGDWIVIPSLVRAFHAAQGIPGTGSQQTSLIRVDALSSQLWWIHDQTVSGAMRGRRMNANAGSPVSIKHVAEVLASKIDNTIPIGEVPRADAESRMSEAGFSGHQVLMLVDDDWFASQIPVTRGATGIAFDIDADSAAWYRSTLKVNSAARSGGRRQIR